MQLFERKPFPLISFLLLLVPMSWTLNRLFTEHEKMKSKKHTTQKPTNHLFFLVFSKVAKCRLTKCLFVYIYHTADASNRFTSNGKSVAAIWTVHCVLFGFFLNCGCSIIFFFLGYLACLTWFLSCEYKNKLFSRVT